MRRAVILAAATVAGCTPHAHRAPVAVAAVTPVSVFDRAETFRANRGTPRTAPLPVVPPPAAPAPKVPATTTTVVGTGADLGTFEATCYGPPEFSAGKRTASGAPVGPGSIAADPRVIPMGTRLAVSGWGTGTVVDTGGAIRGRRLDLWVGSYAACVQFGRRTVRVRRLP